MDFGCLTVSRLVQGRLKLCLNAVWFDPVDDSLPLLSMRLNEMSIGMWNTPPDLASVIDDGVISIHAKTVVRTKAHGQIGPRRREPVRFYLIDLF